jgi:asparagine synthase (glutamine-hydrolysing)
MCGIVGFVNLDGAPADSGVLEAMTDMIRHRGPDDRGTRYLSLRGGTNPFTAMPDTALGFQRLKILDLSDRGHQPMTGADRTITLLFNGEIYEAFDWKSELERRGYRFRTATDTEVILALYEHEGLDRMLERLDGMFAIAIADTRAGVVHLIRDRVGIKPLYWAQCGTTVLFASEVKAFLAHPAFRAEIDPAHVDELLAFRYVAGEASLLKGVRHVKPGHRLAITPDGVTEARYWSIPDYPDTDKLRLSHEDAVDRLGSLLGRSVALQLRSDVPVGCQLSGGIDSSLVAILARAHRRDGRDGRDDLDAFSIVFNERRFSEEPWILAAAAAARVVSHRFVFDETAFMDALDAASWHMDQPISHPNSLALWLLARCSREHATVLLSGEGADELFGGYRRFAEAQADAQTDARIDAQNDPIDAFIRATQFHPETRLAKLRPEANLRTAIERRRALFEEGRADHLSNCMKYDMQSHLLDLLMRQDKMMMAHGVENRVPFLDRRVIEFARALPAEHLVGQSAAASAPDTKRVLKALASRSFDAAFVYRRKSGFNLPLAQYFRGDRFVALMEERLLPGMAARGLVDVAIVRRWWRRALKAHATTEAFWIPVALELWAQQFIDRVSLPIASHGGRCNATRDRI